MKIEKKLLTLYIQKITKILIAFNKTTSPEQKLVIFSINFLKPFLARMILFSDFLLSLFSLACFFKSS